MTNKAVSLVVVFLVGISAFPVDHEISKFFDYTDASARIVGGTISGHVPYMVALTMGATVRNLLCGGSLITTRHVLTAAHCVDGAFSVGHRFESIRGHVGTTVFRTGGTTYHFSHNISHPEYDGLAIKHDIAVLVTTTEVKLTDRVALVPLSYDFIDAGVPTTVHGWGMTAMVGMVSPILMRLDGFVVDSNECVEWVARRAEEIDMKPYIPPVDPAGEVCSYQPNNRGMCHGDSGSAMIRSDLKQQIGIVSWGLPCAREAPDVFVRISEYKSWIERSIR